MARASDRLGRPQSSARTNRRPRRAAEDLSRQIGRLGIGAVRAGGRAPAPREVARRAILTAFSTASTPVENRTARFSPGMGARRHRISATSTYPS